MKTILLRQPGQFEMSDAPAADSREPGPGEALVRVRRVGICGTDLHAFRGRQPFFTYPRILGHELGVEVVAIAPTPSKELNIRAAAPRGSKKLNTRPGPPCPGEPYLNCGVCVACRAGKTNCCVKLQCLGVH